MRLKKGFKFCMQVAKLLIRRSPFMETVTLRAVSHSPDATKSTRQKMQSEFNWFNELADSVGMVGSCIDIYEEGVDGDESENSQWEDVDELADHPVIQCSQN
jgi:hypothetical protein